MKKLEENSNRIDSFDLLKTISIFCVIFYHGWTATTISPNNFSFINSFNYFIKSFLSICVPTFFLVNGALLLNKSLDIKKHCKKILKLFLLVIAWDIIDVFLHMLFNGKLLSLPEFLQKALTFELDWSNQLWFLMALIVVYLFFPLIKCTYDNNAKSYKFFLIITLILTFGNTIISMSSNIVLFLIGGTPIVYEINFFGELNPFRGIYGYTLVYFMLGGILYTEKYNIKLRKNSNIYILIIPFCMLLFTLYASMMIYTANIKFDIVWKGYDTIFCLFNTIALYFIASKYKYTKKPIHKLIQLISQNTMGIYLLQTSIILFTKPAFRTLGISSYLLPNFIYVLMVLLICLVLCLLIKKLPLIKIIINL